MSVTIGWRFTKMSWKLVELGGLMLGIGGIWGSVLPSCETLSLRETRQEMFLVHPSYITFEAVLEARASLEYQLLGRCLNGDDVGDCSSLGEQYHAFTADLQLLLVDHPDLPQVTEDMGELNIAILENMRVEKNLMLVGVVGSVIAYMAAGRSRKQKSE